MAQKNSSEKKEKQLSLEEYAKIKEKLAKSKLKVNFPWIVKLCFIIPVVYGLFLIIYYVANVRLVAEH